MCSASSHLPHLWPALAAEFYVVYPKPDRLWYEGRAAAESVKTLHWRYMVGGKPFDIRLTTDDADRAFVEALRDILHDLQDLDATPAITAEQQITDEMRRVRALTLKDRRGAYNVTGWKISARGTRARRLLTASDGASCRTPPSRLSSLCVRGRAQGFSGRGSRLLGPIAAAAAGLAAWSQAKQYQTLQRAYSLQVRSSRRFDPKSAT